LIVSAQGIKNSSLDQEPTSLIDEFLREQARAAQLPTPCLLIDSAVVERNIQRLADYCQTHGLALRPHAKTHKSLKIAQLQLAAGSRGLTAAKPGEALVMARLDAPLLIAYPPITTSCAAAIREVAERGDLLVALDSAEAVARLEAAAPPRGRRVGALVDVDIGLHRTGVAAPEHCVALAQRIAASPRLRFDGLFCYPGHIWAPVAEQGPPLAAADELVAAHRQALRDAGLEPAIVSGGSTPTAYQTHMMPSVTEIRPGTYVFNDRNTVAGGFCTLADCAVRILATVVSDAVAGQVVVDAGSKTLSSDRCIPAPTSGHGLVVEYPQATITHLSEEHGQVDVSRCQRRPAVGELLTIIPNHVCPTINLADSAWWLAAGDEPETIPIDARGMVR